MVQVLDLEFWNIRVSSCRIHEVEILEVQGIILFSCRTRVVQLCCGEPGTHVLKVFWTSEEIFGSVLIL